MPLHILQDCSSQHFLALAMLAMASECCNQSTSSELHFAQPCTERTVKRAAVLVGMMSKTSVASTLFSVLHLTASSPLCCLTLHLLQSPDRHIELPLSCCMWHPEGSKAMQFFVSMPTSFNIGCSSAPRSWETAVILSWLHFARIPLGTVGDFLNLLFVMLQQG